MSEHDPFQPICGKGHSIEIVSEGYGICRSEDWGLYHAWAFTRPVNRWKWFRDEIIGRNGAGIVAWVHVGPMTSKEDALAAIQEDIDMRRALPFDEETERARLMPV